MTRTVLLSRLDVNKLFLTIQLQRSVTNCQLPHGTDPVTRRDQTSDICIGVFAQDVEEGGSSG